MENMKEKKYIPAFFAKAMLLAFFTYCLTPALALAECNGRVPLCSEALGSEKSGGCSPDKQKNSGLFSSISSGSNINASCVSSKTKDSCYNSVPTSWTGSYTLMGYRPNGAGGNPKPRNHYGSDLGTGGKTNVLAFAPSDGIIKGWGWAGGGGRTLVFEHTKKCVSSNSKDSKVYSTLFRHLYKIFRTSGGVKKGEKVGVVGGSNSSGGSHCDAVAQGGGKKGGCSPYAIHLHMEVVDGPVNPSSTWIGNKNALQPSCGGLAALCGECNSGTNTCDKKQKSATNGPGATGDEANYANDGESSEAESNCNLEQYLNKESCTSCGIFKIIFNSASAIAATAMKKLAGPSKNLVLIGFSIWLAIYILKQIASAQAAKPGDMLKGIILQGTRVAVVVFILQGAFYEVLNLTLNPVMQTGLSFSQLVNTTSSKKVDHCPKSADFMQGIMGYDDGLSNTSVGGLPHSLGSSIICSIKTLEDNVGTLAALGNYSSCIAFHDKALWDGILPHLGYLTTGWFLWLVGIILLLAMPWCLIDCILQLCIAAAMMPCAIAAYAFKPTAKYISTVWNFFMNAMFNLVFMSIVIFIINFMFLDWIGIKDGDLSNFDPARFVTAGGGGLAWWGLDAFKVLAACFLFWCFFGEAAKMANNFANGSGLNIGKPVGSIPAQMAKAGAKGAGHLLGKAAKATGEAANSLAGNWARSKVNQAKGMAMSAMGGRKIRDENGKVIGYQSRFKIPGFTQTRTVMKDANGVWTQTKETHQKTAADKAFKPMKDANGNTTWAVKTGGVGPFAKYEQMTKTTDPETGNSVYTSKDGKSRLVVDKEGNILQYQRKKDKTMQTEHRPGSVRTTNDSLMKKRVMTDANGNVIGTDIEFQNVSAQYLVNKDGSTNMHAFNQIMNGVSAENKADAMAAMVGMHMAARGQSLDNRFKNREVAMDKNGGVTITQTNRDGSQQIITASMVNGQMVISNKTTDAKGNITIQKSNGVQNKTSTYTRQKDGSYIESTKYSFTDEAHSRSRITSPLDKNGAWGYGIDPQKAMAGFSKEEFDEHLKQLKQGGLFQKQFTAEEMKDLANGKKVAGKELLDRFTEADKKDKQNSSDKDKGENKAAQMEYELARLEDEYQKLQTQSLKIKNDYKNAQYARDIAKAKLDRAKATANSTKSPRDIEALNKANEEYLNAVDRCNKLSDASIKIKESSANLFEKISNLTIAHDKLKNQEAAEEKEKRGNNENENSKNKK